MENKIHKENYNFFLTKLKDYHRLSLLQPFSNEEAMIQSNLETLNIRYMLPFSAYFGNATFRFVTEMDITDAKFNRIMFDVLARFQDQSIISNFKACVSTIYKEYKQGFEDLFEIAIPITAQWCIEHNRPKVQQFIYTENATYSLFRAQVLTCLPDKWKKKNDSLPGVLCLSKNAFYVTDLDNQKKMVLKGFIDSSDILNEIPDDALFYDDIETVSSTMKDLLRDEANRKAVSDLMEAFLNRNNRDNTLSVINDYGSITTSFIERLNILIKYYKGV